MTGETDPARLGARVGDRVRAAILLRLLDGAPASASELARAASASPSLASAHLRRLLDGKLVLAEPEGRRRLYHITSVDVAEMLETMQRVAPEQPVTSLRQAQRKDQLRWARMCDDHLARVLGTAVTEGLIERGGVRADEGGFTLAGSATDVLDEVGIDVGPLRELRRPLVKSGTDWAERRPHLAGGLGAAVAARLLQRCWVVRRAASRGLDVTTDGAQGLRDWLGIDLEKREGWASIP